MYTASRIFSHGDALARAHSTHTRIRERASARACRCAVRESSGRAQGERRAGRGGCPPGARAPTGKTRRVHPQRAAAISIAGNVVSHAMRPRNATPRQPRVGLLTSPRARGGARAGNGFAKSTSCSDYAAEKKRTRRWEYGRFLCFSLYVSGPWTFSDKAPFH